MASLRTAPGAPGIEPRWTTSAKSAVGTALSDASRVWFTASHGILNELYYPEVDNACIRDAGFLVSTDDGFVSEEKRDCEHTVQWLADGVPAFRLTNRCRAGRYTIEKRLCTSPEFHAVLQQTDFTPHDGALSDYHLTFLLAPHLGNRGAGNSAWIGTQRGQTILFAQREGYTVAVAISAPWRATSVGYVGASDGWQDIHAHGRLTTRYDSAPDGNVALAGEIDLVACNGRFTVAIGFGADPETAALHARGALADPYDEVERRYAAPWAVFQESLEALDEPTQDAEPAALYRASTAVLMTHLTMNSDGGAIASLSIPWGDAKGDDDLGGYHLVWPRDMVQTAGGLLAAGAHGPARSMLRYLFLTQEADGRWPQNMWLNGTPYWTGIQLDETALPVLLYDLAAREGCLEESEADHWWIMVRRAALYLAAHGPITEQDRWEENAGYTPYTLATCIAALVVAAEFATRENEPQLARYLLDTADDWHDRIDTWTYVEGTPLAQEVGVAGYYVRITPANRDDASSKPQGTIPVKNRPSDAAPIDLSELISPDALAYVRYGLRLATDARMRDTVRVIDHLVRAQTATGPVWYRYNADGYGEHPDGGAFDGTGVGRGWVLLAGERAHYELAAGNTAMAAELAQVMRRQASAGLMLPEQVWEADDIPERELFNGRPAGSAMPLAWSHAEYIKLMRSVRDDRVFDVPSFTVARYLDAPVAPRVALWRFSLQRHTMPAGRMLRLDLGAPARVRWTTDAWATARETASVPISAQTHIVELDVETVPAGGEVVFTCYWPDVDRWEGRDFTVRVV